MQALGLQRAAEAEQGTRATGSTWYTEWGLSVSREHKLFRQGWRTWTLPGPESPCWSE